MIAALLKFEIAYQRKLWALPAAMILYFLIGFQIGGQGFAPDMVDFNAPYQISYYTSIFTLGAVFAIMFFVINGILRDSTHRMQEIIFSTGVRKYQFFLSRFGGVFIFSLLSVSTLLPGMMTGTLIMDLDPDRLAPVTIFPYFWNWFVFVLPNVLICTSFIFSVGLLTKNRISIYASAILVYVFYFVSSFYFESPILAGSTPAHTEKMMLAALGDPFGISAFMEQSQYLTPLQKNEVLVSLTGNFLLNRILWISIALAILGVTYRLFSFRSLQRKKQKTFSDDDQIQKPASIDKKYIPVSPSGSTFWQAFLTQSNMGFKQMLKSLPFQVMMLFIIFIMGAEFYSRLLESGSYSESLYPVTSILAGINSTAVFIFGVLLIVFFSGEWTWKERSENMYLILDSTPASNASFFWSKVSVLMSIPFLFVTFEIAIGIGFQLLLDYHRFDLATYYSLYYYQGIPLVFYILIAVFVQSLSPGKYLGMALTGAIIIVFGTPLASNLGLEHPLLRIGFMPDVSFSDMSGISNTAPAFHLLSTHWMLLGLIISVLALHLWRRGISESFQGHVLKIFRGWSLQKLSILSLLIAGFLCASGMIYYKTNIETEYLSTAQMLDCWAEYEKTYKQKYHDEKWLYPIAIKTDVALFPQNRSYSVEASYMLENKSETFVSRALIIGKKKITQIEMEGATLVGQDSTLGIFEFEFASPIQPGDSVELSFSAISEKQGLYSGRDLVKNGSFVNLRDFSPYLGYTSSLEISDNSERLKRGLEKRIIEHPSDADFELMESGFGRIRFETTLSVPSNQVGISVGNLIETWKDNDRNSYRFQTVQPVSPMITYHSADYSTNKEMYHGISLEHYFHSGHDFNNSTVMESMKYTLDYARQEFGDYTLNHLRIVEIPSYWGFGGIAASGTVSMVEDNLYLVDERDPDAFGLVAKRTIHEVAHQWWGNQLSSQNIGGGGIFVEGFAKYSEAVVMEKHYGMASLFQLSESANHTYFTGRSYASMPEQPLYLEQGEHYMLYGKTYIVMMALKDLLGEKTINQVLKTLVQRHKNEIDPSVTTPEFLNELYQVSSPKQHSLIDDWFKKIITYDLSVKDAGYTELPNGKFEITLSVDATKFESIDGIESPVPLEEPIQIGLFKTHPSEADDQEIIWLESYSITDGRQQITIQVDSTPEYVSIDPYGTRPDLVRNDNWIKLK